MFCRHPSPVPSKRVVICCFVSVAPFTARRDIVVVVRAAILERDDVICIPIICRAELAAAFVAPAISRVKYRCAALRRHAAPRVMLKSAHTLSNPLTTNQ